ncbi:MAG: C4-type zinc ribbon domain-containing protein [Dehalococcoidia bacterium]
MRQLYDLQELDWDVDRYQAELASIEARLRDDTQVVKARAELAEGEKILIQLRRQHVRHDQDVQELRQRVQALESRLYSGTVRNPRELDGLQAELTYAKEHAGKGDEELLGLMIELDENEERVAKAQTDLAQLEKDWEETHATLAGEQKVLAEQLRDSMAKRQQFTVDIASSLMSRYERLRTARQGYAVAKVERGRCVGCRLTLPINELQRARSAKEPVVCNSCGRMLYVS